MAAHAGSLLVRTGSPVNILKLEDTLVRLLVSTGGAQVGRQLRLCCLPSQTVSACSASSVCKTILWMALLYVPGHAD